MSSLPAPSVHAVPATHHYPLVRARAARSMMSGVIPKKIGPRRSRSDAVGTNLQPNSAPASPPRLRWRSSRSAIAPVRCSGVRHRITNGSTMTYAAPAVLRLGRGSTVRSSRRPRSLGRRWRAAPVSFDCRTRRPRGSSGSRLSCIGLPAPPQVTARITLIPVLRHRSGGFSTGDSALSHQPSVPASRASDPPSTPRVRDARRYEHDGSVVMRPA